MKTNDNFNLPASNLENNELKLTKYADHRDLNNRKSYADCKSIYASRQNIHETFNSNVISVSK